ncbi:serine threonine kinase [Fusarium sp. NRRL 52700]|nr:serine threonine kinase [Fusarium sp. NRRL 52700]
MSEPSSNPLKSALKSSLLREKDSLKRMFVPANVINSICNQVTVYEYILRCYIDPDAVKFSEYVCNTMKPARKVFSIQKRADCRRVIEFFDEHVDKAVQAKRSSP